MKTRLRTIALSALLLLPSATFAKGLLFRSASTGRWVEVAASCLERDSLWPVGRSTRSIRRQLPAWRTSPPADASPKR